MTTPSRRTRLRHALTIGAVAIAASVAGATSSTAAAAPAPVTSLDTPANWAVVAEAAAGGYQVPAELDVNCGIDR